MSLESALKKWANSKEGETHLKQCQINAIKKGDFQSAFGRANHDPAFYAEELIRILNLEFAAYGYDFGNYLYWYDAGYDEAREKFVVYVDFKREELDRPSLYPSKYPDGVDNIVALLNNGYHTKNYVYGDWHGQRIRSLKDRADLWFIQDAVTKFNSLYGDEVFIYFSEEYGWQL